MATILVKRDYKLTDPELAMFASKSRAEILALSCHSGFVSLRANTGI